MAALTYLYKTEGFIDANVSEDFQPTEDSLAAIIRITIDEGPRYFIRQAYSRTTLGRLRNGRIATFVG